MQQLNIYEIFSTGIICLLATLYVLGYHVERERETRKVKYRISFWKIVRQAGASFGLGFLAISILQETEWGSGRKMLVVLLAALLGGVILDALMMIQPSLVFGWIKTFMRKLVNGLASWILKQTGGTNDEEINPE